MRALGWLGSHEVADAVVYLDLEYSLTDDEVREVLREHWTRCDAPGAASDYLLDLFRRVGYVSDSEERLTGTLTVYRGTFGDDPRSGISWTLDEGRAEWFSERGARGAGRARTESKVWRGTVDAEAILGYFTERNEAEVIVDPATIRDVVVA